MVSSERTRSRTEWDVEEDVEVNIDIVRDDDDDKYGYDKSKPRSSKSRKPVNSEEADGLDGSGRKRTSSDRHDSRKRVSGSGKAAADQDDYEARKESRKHLKKKSEDNMLDKLSTWYQDGESEKKVDGSERSGKHNVNVEKEMDKDSRYSERRDGGRERGHGISEQGRSSRKRWDESGSVGKADGYVEKSDTRLGNPSDTKLESARERVSTMEIQSNESKSRGLESIENKTNKSLDGDERKVDSERSKRGRTEAPEEDNTRGLTFDDKSTKERTPAQDIAVNLDRAFNADEDVSMSSRDRNRRDMEISKSRTPEKTGKRQFESDEMDYERSSSFRRKDQGKDFSYDDRSKGRDDSWGDRNRDRDNSKEPWKRRQDKTTRDGETIYDNKDWALPRRQQDWFDGDKHQSRFSGRKDGSRTEAVKTSSKYGISNENYDVIEIHTKPFDHSKDESRPVFAKNESTQQADTKLTPEVDEFASMQDQRSWKGDNDVQMEKYKGPKTDEANRGLGNQSSTSGPLPPYGNRIGRGGRGRFTGRDGPMPIVGSPFGQMGLPPPRPMHSLTTNMSPSPCPPISPGGFMPPFQPHIMWPGARGVDMNMLAFPPGFPPGPMGPRFPPNLGNPQNGSIFSPSGAGGGMIPSISSPNFNAMVRGQMLDKWIPNRTNAPPGKAPSRGEQNDYSQNFVDTGTRPQNYIRELEPTSVVEDYPKLRELIQRKDEIVAKSASPPMYHKCDLREQVLSPEFFGTKFDVILVDPPWEEYVHRAPGVTDHMDHWTFEEIMNLKIEAIADTPSFIFLWVGDGVGLEQGRQCLKKWGFRRCEDICWVKTNKTNATPGLRHDSHTLYQRTKEHCLMGIKGTVRRSTDGHIIHANIDTDVIIAEEPPYGSTAKPEDMYRIIEHFALGRRRLELFGGDHNIRSGWLTLGNGLTSSNFNSQVYIKNFADKDGKVWVGGAGRNPPPEAPHLALTTPEIESLRPKSPMKNQQQLQQQPSLAISLTTPTSGNKRPTGNSPGPMNQDASSSSIPSPAPWASSPMVREGDMYAFNAPPPFGPGAGGDFFDFESQRRMNML